MKINTTILIIGFLALFACEASKNRSKTGLNSNNEIPKAEKGSIANEPTPSTSPVIQSEEIASLVSVENADSAMNLKSGPWSITALEDYSKEEDVKVTFTNNTQQNIIVYNPLRKNIERLVDKSWIPVEVVYCSCRPCPAPPESREVRPGRSYAVKWSKKEDNCNQNKFTQSLCKSGVYRISISYRINGTRSVESVEFEI